MGKRFEFYKLRQGTRQQIQDGIAKRAERIADVEGNTELLTTTLNEAKTMPAHLKDPFIELGEAMLPTMIEDSEKIVAGLKQNHADYVAECQKPSAAFPQGVI